MSNVDDLVYQVNRDMKYKKEAALDERRYRVGFIVFGLPAMLAVFFMGHTFFTALNNTIQRQRAIPPNSYTEHYSKKLGADVIKLTYKGKVYYGKRLNTRGVLRLSWRWYDKDGTKIAHYNRFSLGGRDLTQVYNKLRSEEEGKNLVKEME